MDALRASGGAPSAAPPPVGARTRAAVPAAAPGHEARLSVGRAAPQASWEERRTPLPQGEAAAEAARARTAVAPPPAAAVAAFTPAPAAAGGQQTAAEKAAEAAAAMNEEDCDVNPFM